ncbi:hypothetical protein A2U01_0097432, partial [Trifolium medium]|nr:hypothetical protein [Trifolium medium]
MTVAEIELCSSLPSSTLITTGPNFFFFMSGGSSSCTTDKRPLQEDGDNFTKYPPA